MRMIQINEWLRIKRGVGLIIMMIMVCSVWTVTYAEDYTLLAPLPGLSNTSTDCIEGSGTGCKTKLGTYLPAAFNLAIAIAAVMAFVMITWGGIMYATSDAITGKTEGRRYIENALWGLLLVIGAYVILYTLNPKILSFDLSLQRPSVPVGIATVTTRTPLDTSGLADDATIRSTLFGIDINNNPCTTGRTTGCTNVNGLPLNAVSGLIELKRICNCNITITGGTEGGHATHGPNKPIVDLRPDINLNKYIWGNANVPTDGTTRAKTLPNGQRVTFTYEVLGGNARGTSTGNHWHVVIR